MPAELRVPVMGESVTEATILRWLKKEGDTVAAGEPLVELETDKVNVEVPAEQAGVLQQIARAEGETVAVGDVLGLMGEAGAVPKEAGAGEKTARNGEGPTDGSSIAASPLARALAEENNVDLRLIKGSGGRISRDEVANYIEHREAIPATANTLAEESAPKEAPPAPSSGGTRGSSPVPPLSGARGISSARPEERSKMSRRRQTIATRLVEAQRTAAMLTTFNEIDMSAVMAVRARRKDSFKEKNGVGLGFMSFFTKASIGALKAFPLLNAEIQGQEIVKKGYYDIGIAVGAEEGLVVPVLRDADRKTFAGIEREIGELAKKARENSLSLAELQGGTFTITNGGVFGSLMSTPILNAPQVGILGLHKIEERPIAKGGEVIIRPMMYVALSYDHRIVDGSEAVRFLVKIKELVEDPESLLLEG